MPVAVRMGTVSVVNGGGVSGEEARMAARGRGAADDMACCEKLDDDQSSITGAHWLRVLLVATGRSWAARVMGTTMELGLLETAVRKSLPGWGRECYDFNEDKDLHV